MSLLSYFKREMPRNSLPDPHEPLNIQILSSSIQEANKVDIFYKATSAEKKRSPYSFAIPEHKAKIGKYAAETSRSIAWLETREDTCAYLAPKVQAPGKLSEATII